MIVFVDADGAVTLREADDFKGFKLVRERAGGGFAAPGQNIAYDPDGTHAWVPVAFLSGFGEAARDAAWREKLDGMIAYAGSKGWLSDDNNAIRAHIETP